MKKAIITILFLSALGAPLNAKAVSADELIRQKQFKAKQLKLNSVARVDDLRNVGSSGTPVLQGGFSHATKLDDLETASGSTIVLDETKPSAEPDVSAAESTIIGEKPTKSGAVSAKNHMKPQQVNNEPVEPPTPDVL